MLARVEDKFIPEPNSGCWLWHAGHTPAGYGTVRIKGVRKYAHRVVYEELVGDIPAGLDLDHLCRVTACVNPEHLEPVTRKENCRRGLVGQYNARKRQCRSGHPFDMENTGFYKSRKRRGFGGRYCKICRAALDARRYRQLRGQ